MLLLELFLKVFIYDSFRIVIVIVISPKWHLSLTILSLWMLCAAKFFSAFISLVDGWWFDLNRRHPSHLICTNGNLALRAREEKAAVFDSDHINL